MKRILLILLVCTMLFGSTTCFSSCDLIKNNKGEPIVLENVGESKDKIDELSAYLRRLNGLINPNSVNLEDKIEWVKNDVDQALHVAFDPKDYYFICAYYNANHNEDEYCCVNEYTWVAFYKQNDITEQYENKNFVVAFQINKTKFVKDIVYRKADTPEFEHFLVYIPVFEEGINIADEILFDETYIYFRGVEFENKDYILDSTQERFHELSIVPCVKYKGKYYIKQETKIGYGNPIDLKPKFGKYYDDLMEIMITNKYTEEIEGKTYYYGLFEINEFAKKFWK